MTKIRVYEVAKELGVESKDILSVCQELGMEDKKSHTTGLDEGEINEIKRALDKKKIESGEVKVRSVETEVERKGDIVTEKRVGTVIRRRKKIEDEVSEVSSEKPVEAEYIQQEDTKLELIKEDVLGNQA